MQIWHKSNGIQWPNKTKTLKIKGRSKDNPVHGKSCLL